MLRVRDETTSCGRLFQTVTLAIGSTITSSIQPATRNEQLVRRRQMKSTASSVGQRCESAGKIRRRRTMQRFVDQHSDREPHAFGCMKEVCCKLISALLMSSVWRID